MPDLESFIISAKNQEDLKSGIQRKKKRKIGEACDDNDDDEDFMDFQTSYLNMKSQGTKSRPGYTAQPSTTEEVKQSGGRGSNQKNAYQAKEY